MGVGGEEQLTGFFSVVHPSDHIRPARWKLQIFFGWAAGVLTFHTKLINPLRGIARSLDERERMARLNGLPPRLLNHA